MTYEHEKDLFFQWIAEHWEQQKNKLQRFCANQRLPFDDDVYSETVTKIAERILKKGLKDTTPKGMENYLFKSFKINTLRERDYARNKKRDHNVTDITQLYEDWANEHQLTPTSKLLHDLKQDFSLLYLASVVIEHYGEQSAHLFLTKYCYRYTYKQMQAKFSNIKHLREHLLEIKHFLQEHVTKEEINAAFWTKYGNLI